MTRKTKCTVCARYLGEIRDAKLAVGVAHICKRCEARRLEVVREWNKLRQNPVESLKPKDRK